MIVGLVGEPGASNPQTYVYTISNDGEESIVCQSGPPAWDDQKDGIAPIVNSGCISDSQLDFDTNYNAEFVPYENDSWRVYLGWNASSRCKKRRCESFGKQLYNRIAVR